MTDLSLPISSHRSGYAAQRHRSPAALGAAIALNGGAFALILALPATKYTVDRSSDTPTHWIELDPTPPENPPEPVKAKKPAPIQHAAPTPREDPLPFVPEPVVPLTNGGAAIGGTLPHLGGLGVIGEVKSTATPPHKPVFKAATQDPRYAQAFHPDYPPALRREGLEGSATVRISIDETGRVTAVELVKATDLAFYEETREQALRHWRFRPATSDGVPVPSQQTLTVTFRLEGE